jgi:hypothetical protein
MATSCPHSRRLWRVLLEAQEAYKEALQKQFDAIRGKNLNFPCTKDVFYECTDTMRWLKARSLTTTGCMAAQELAQRRRTHSKYQRLRIAD